MASVVGDLCALGLVSGAAGSVVLGGGIVPDGTYPRAAVPEIMRSNDV